MTPFDQVDTYRTVAVTGTPRSTRYGYDNLGRLTTATDRALGATGAPTGAACTRSYGFDVNSNRVALTQTASAGAPAGTCPATVPAGDAYGYDTADRLQAIGARGALRYDALGRTRTLPSVDTIGAGGDVAIDYYVDDLVSSMTQAGKTTTFGLDATARRTVRTDTDAATPGISRKTTSYYTGDDDKPDVVKESDNSYTRNVLSFGGLVATVANSGTQGAAVTLQLANLHGDIAANVPLTATSPNDLTTIETTEYGLPRAAPAAGTTQSRYGWLGTHQRDASTLGGLTLMGVRLYAPTLGRFLSVDPIPGGNANPYVYPEDPIGAFDIDGRCGTWGNPFKSCGLWKKDTTWTDSGGRMIPLRYGSRVRYKEGGVQYGKFGARHMADSHMSLRGGGPGQNKWATYIGMKNDVGRAIMYGTRTRHNSGYKSIYTWTNTQSCGCGKPYTVTVIVDDREAPGGSGRVGIVTAWKNGL
ncbi:RHS repeat-associated core domain-containing protein [Blastococcus fimeti]|nr:RHS repeat-associated core domain-containing protein [Blastococcus fimeti]